MNRILMIEDNEDHSFLIRHCLESPDCAVSRCNSGEAALKYCAEAASQGVPPQLIFLDLKLEGIDGFQVLKSLRRLDSFAHVPIVILSTSSRKADIQNAYSLGATSYVVKNENFETLKDKLKQVKAYWFNLVETA